jgi:crossover junction endodeoxyribonuclease RuvC
MIFEDRLVFMYDRLGEIIDGAAPQQVAVETTFFGKDANAAARLGEARGVLVLAARKAGLPVAHYTPAEVKKAVVGRGRATKEQVQFMIARLLSLSEVPRPLDASDALAIALCHLHQPGFNPHQVGRQRKLEIEALLRRVKKR